MRRLKSICAAGVLFLLVGGWVHSDTRIKGGKMELINKGDEVIFTDGVRLDQGTDRITAQKMVTDQGRTKIHAYGNVQFSRVLEEGETLDGNGDQGYYDTEAESGYLVSKKGKSHMVHTEVISSTETRIIDIYATRFDFSQESSSAIAKGEVYGKSIDQGTQDEFEFWSDVATYNSEAKIIHLEGDHQPRVFQNLGESNRTIWGDAITYNVDDEIFISKGRAMAVLVDAEPAEESKD